MKHYIDISDYTTFAYEPSNEIQDHFGYYVSEAERYIDRITSGVDNVKKLHIAFPTDENDAFCVKRCMIKVIEALASIQESNRHLSEAMAEGKSGIIASVSSGSESISYVTDAAIVRASQDPIAKAAYINAIIKECLSGVKDANGVNLLYGGAYPYV